MAGWLQLPTYDFPVDSVVNKVITSAVAAANITEGLCYAAIFWARYSLLYIRHMAM